MEEENIRRLSRNCYYVCLVLVIIFLSVYGILVCFEIPITKLNPTPCILYSIFGLYCPGCGGTRAVMYLMQGEVTKSFLHHPVVPYTAILLSVYIVSHTLNILTKGRLKAMKFRPIYLYLIVVIILIQFLVKNAYVFISGSYPFM